MESDSSKYFNKVEFYSYELVFKKNTKQYLERFDISAARVEDNKEPKFSTTYFERDFTNIIHEWDLSEGLEKCWDRIDELDSFLNWSKFSKPYVQAFQLFFIEIPYLPYDLMIIRTILNKNKIKNVTQSNDLLNIMASVNSFIGTFPGVINDLKYGAKTRPCYLKYDINVNNKYLEDKIKKIKILKENKELKNQDEIKKYHDTSKKLRISHLDLESKDYEMMSMLVKGKSVSLLGFLESTDQMTYNNYEISFNPANKILMWARNTSFDNQIDYDFTHHVHFVSILLFLTYTIRKLDEHEVTFEKLVSKYHLKNEKIMKDKKKLYHNLCDFEENLFFIKSDLEKIDFVLKEPLNIAINEIRGYNLMSPKQFEQKHIFSNGMLESVFKHNQNRLKQNYAKLSELQKKGSDLKNKFEKDIIFENTISMNKNAKRNLWLTLSMLIMSSIITIKIIFDVIFGG